MISLVPLFYAWRTIRSQSPGKLVRFQKVGLHIVVCYGTTSYPARVQTIFFFFTINLRQEAFPVQREALGYVQPKPSKMSRGNAGEKYFAFLLQQKWVVNSSNVKLAFFFCLRPSPPLFFASAEVRRHCMLGMYQESVHGLFQTSLQDLWSRMAKIRYHIWLLSFSTGYITVIPQLPLPRLKS